MWPSRHNLHIALPLFLLLSLGIHGAAVAFFQIEYPRAAGRRAHPATVYFLAPHSPENTTLSRTIAGNDSAIFSSTHLASEELESTPYEPSYKRRKPSLENLPPLALAANPTLISSALANPLSTAKGRPQPKPGPVTTVRWGAPLAGREVRLPQTAKFAPDRREGLSSVEFLVGVGPDGKPVHFIPLTSSGDPLVDQAAVEYIAAARFAPVTEEDPVWASARIVWGADITPIEPK